jgi:hypothetical protein
MAEAAEPSAGHSDIDEWFRRQMPHLQPIVQGLDESIRATIPGLHYAVKWKRPCYGLPERGWIIELAAYDVSVNVVFLGGADFDFPTAARNHRPDPVHEGDHSGGGTTTRAAQVDRGGEPHTRLDMVRGGRRIRVRQKAPHTPRVLPSSATSRSATGKPREIGAIRQRVLTDECG